MAPQLGWEHPELPWLQPQGLGGRPHYRTRGCVRLLGLRMGAESTRSLATLNTRVEAQLIERASVGQAEIKGWGVELGAIQPLSSIPSAQAQRTVDAPYAGQESTG